MYFLVSSHCVHQRLSPSQPVFTLDRYGVFLSFSFQKLRCEASSWELVRPSEEAGHLTRISSVPPPLSLSTSFASSIQHVLWCLLWDFLQYLPLPSRSRDSRFRMLAFCGRLNLSAAEHPAANVNIDEYGTLFNNLLEEVMSQLSDIMLTLQVFCYKPELQTQCLPQGPTPTSIHAHTIATSTVTPAP